jgi:hypothetical protein
MNQTEVMLVPLSGVERCDSCTRIVLLYRIGFDFFHVINILSIIELALTAMTVEIVKLAELARLWVICNHNAGVTHG